MNNLKKENQFCPTIPTKEKKEKQKETDIQIKISLIFPQQRNFKNRNYVPISIIPFSFSLIENTICSNVLTQKKRQGRRNPQARRISSKCKEVFPLLQNGFPSGILDLINCCDFGFICSYERASRRRKERSKRSHRKSPTSGRRAHKHRYRDDTSSSSNRRHRDRDHRNRDKDSRTTSPNKVTFILQTLGIHQGFFLYSLLLFHRFDFVKVLLSDFYSYLYFKKSFL